MGRPSAFVFKISWVRDLCVGGRTRGYALREVAPQCSKSDPKQEDDQTRTRQVGKGHCELKALSLMKGLMPYESRNWNRKSVCESPTSAGLTPRPYPC